MAASPQVTNTKVGDQIRLFTGKASVSTKPHAHQNKACQKQFQGFLFQSFLSQYDPRNKSQSM